MSLKVLSAIGFFAVSLGLALAPAGADAALPGATRALPPPESTEDSLLSSLVAAPQRSPVNLKRDAARHPVESLTFWGLQPGMTVLEIAPGAGYWTEILAPYAKTTGGRYLATGADPKVASEGALAMRRAFETRFADAQAWGRIDVIDFDAKAGLRLAPASVDLVLTARNLHDWMEVRGAVDAVLASAFAALKPGGVLAIEEHRADPRPMARDAADGYVSEAFAVSSAQKAGFRYDGRSDINANPKDTKDHPFGVWTLPPARRSAPAGQPADPAFDHSRFDAIGESDRMTLRFRKPG